MGVGSASGGVFMLIEVDFRDISRIPGRQNLGVKRVRSAQKLGPQKRKRDSMATLFGPILQQRGNFSLRDPLWTMTPTQSEHV